MADVKKFSGYSAVDGSMHDTMKAALAHSTEVKQKAALKAFADMVENDGSMWPEGESIDEFLFRHREVIQAAFNQKAQLRAPAKTPRKSRAKKAAASDVGSGGTGSPS